MQNKTYKVALQNELSTEVSFPNITLTSDVDCPKEWDFFIE